MRPQTLYSAEEVAKQLGLHVRTIRNYVRGGRLPAVRIGKQYRIASKDLAKLTGQPPSAFESKSSVGQLRSEVSSIVDIHAISPDMAHRLTSLLMGAAIGRGKRDIASRVHAIYEPDRMHMKVILVGTFEDNATHFSLIQGLLRS